MPFKTVDNLRFHVYDSFARHVNVTNVSTTRHAGVSPEPYASLNLGLGTSDDPANVRSNRARLSLLTSHDAGILSFGAQVHGTHVEVVDDSRAGQCLDSTDALITAVPEVAIAILAADCTVVSLYDPIQKAIGVAHAGWRGTAAGISIRIVEAMIDAFDTDPTDLIAGIGPSIGPCCYEVGPETIERFRAEQPLVASHVLSDALGGPGGSVEGEDRMMLNLWRANTLQLVTAGVFEANVEVAGICTSCNTRDFYSHRAEDGRTGRCAGVMMLHEETKRSY